MSKSRTKSAQVGHSWGILIGMSGIPILALLSKVFPHLDTLWGVLLVVFGLLIARSVIGYLFPGSHSGVKKARQAAAQSAAQSH
jgi:hypothetical protein